MYTLHILAIHYSYVRAGWQHGCDLRLTEAAFLYKISLQAAGARVGVLAEGLTTLLAGHIIAFAYSWSLTLVLMSAVPLYILAGWVHSKASLGFAGWQRTTFIDAAEVSSLSYQLEMHCIELNCCL